MGKGNERDENISSKKEIKFVLRRKQGSRNSPVGRTALEMLAYVFYEAAEARILAHPSLQSYNQLVFIPTEMSPRYTGYLNSVAPFSCIKRQY